MYFCYPAASSFPAKPWNQILQNRKFLLSAAATGFHIGTFSQLQSRVPVLGWTEPRMVIMWAAVANRCCCSFADARRRFFNCGLCLLHDIKESKKGTVTEVFNFQAPVHFKINSTDFKSENLFGSALKTGLAPFNNNILIQSKFRTLLIYI